MKIDNITKRYGEKTVFDNFTLNLPDNKTAALFAPSGKGKTTLLRIIADLEKPDSGSVIFSKPEKISYVFQEDRLLPFCSVLENIKFIGADEETALRLIEAVGLKGEENSLPDTLSGGMKRRASIARALACPDYSLLLLDEPFNGLDENTKMMLKELIKKETQGKTCILITHSEEDAAALADDIYRI